MNNSKDILEEFFDPSISETRREEIRRHLMSLPLEDPNRILLVTFESAANEAEINDLKTRVSKLSQPRSQFSYFKIAAVVTLALVSSFLIYLFYPVSQTNQRLFDKYYQPYSGPTILRGETSQEKLLTGLSLYSDKQYTEALGFFIPLLDEETDYSNELHLLIGTCYLEMDQIENSTSYFEKLLGTEVAFTAEWYLSMALLKAGKLDQITKNLEEIANSNSPFKTRASSLLNELEANSSQ